MQKSLSLAMDLLTRFNEIKADLMDLGLIRNKQYETYFCTPENSITFARLGVDGIHFCIIPPREDSNLDETFVCVVSPGNEEHYVEPVARDLKTFFNLVYSIKDAGGLECISYMTKEEFNDYVDTIEIDEDVRNAANVLRDTLDLCEISNVYEVVKEYQSNFNISRIIDQRD